MILMAPELRRIPTGIPGLDEVLGGGIPANYLVLVSGTTGVGKTVMLAQFIYKGAVDYGQNGVFVTFEETPEEIAREMKGFGWNFPRLVKRKRVKFVDFTDPSSLIEGGRRASSVAKKFMDIVEDSIREVGAKRVAVDGLPALALLMKAESPVLRLILRAIRFEFSKLGVTTLMSTEIVEGSGMISRYGVEELVAQGVIVLSERVVGGHCQRVLHIKKMRGSPIPRRLCLYDIVPNQGMVVYPKAIVT